MNTITLGNNWTTAHFDSQNGALVGFTSKAGNWEILRRAELGLSFEMLVPLPDRLSHRISGGKQALTAHNLDGTDRLTLSWEGMTSEAGLHLDISFRGTITLEDRGLRFAGEVHNRSPFPVNVVAWPCLGELSPSPSGHLDCLACTSTDLVRRPLYPYFHNEQGYWGADFPLQKAHTPHTPFLLVAAPEQGLYVGHDDTGSSRLVQFLLELKPGCLTSATSLVPSTTAIAGQAVRIQVLANHFLFVAPGESQTLSAVVLCPYTGSWHSGVDCYKRWRTTWHRPAAAPEWCREIHSWQQVQVNSIAGEQRCRYSELIRHGEQCARHGVSAIQLTGWTENGQDGRMPSHATDPRLGTWEDLRAAIARLRALGVKVILYEKFVYADVGTAWYRNELQHYVTRDIFGNPAGHSGWAYYLPEHFAGFNMRRLDWGCMNHSAWRRICCEEYARSLDLDPDGVLLDESCHPRGDGRYCFAPDHGHDVPAFNPQGDSILLSELNLRANRHSREQVIVGESCHDLQTREYGMTYTRIAAGHIPALRYIDPHYPIMVAVTGLDDRETINLCLMYRYLISYEPLNFKGCLDDFPLTIEYGKLIDALRRRYRDLVWDAVFEDRRGATVTVGDAPHQEFSVFRCCDSGRRTAVIANQGHESAISVEVSLEGYAGGLFRASPEFPDPVLFGGCFVIPARSVAIVFQPE